MKPRHREILAALRALGGKASIRQIAAHADLDVNGVSQTFSAKYQFPVRFVEGRGGDAVYELIEEETDASGQLSLLKQ